jgi:hypothetical protein
VECPTVAAKCEDSSYSPPAKGAKILQKFATRDDLRRHFEVRDFGGEREINNHRERI